MVLTASDYMRLRALIKLHDQRTEEVAKAAGTYGKHGYSVTAEQMADIARELGHAVTNEDRSAVETFSFRFNPPATYFAYVNEEKRTLTTWTGETLGTVTFGNAYADNFGGKRIPIRVLAINGQVYSGTYFASAGNYARLKLIKSCEDEARSMRETFAMATATHEAWKTIPCGQVDAYVNERAQAIAQEFGLSEDYVRNAIQRHHVKLEDIVRNFNALQSN